MVGVIALVLALRADFVPNATLPKTNVYTDCGGKNVSPALHWSGAPEAARSFVLTVFDPDAPREGGWWHWIAFNILPSTQSLPANSGARASATTGMFAKNDFGHPRYDGPCPPPGKPHRYVFTLYALDVPQVHIADGPGVDAALRGHILAKAEVIGRYGR